MAPQDQTALLYRLRAIACIVRAETVRKLSRKGKFGPGAASARHFVWAQAWRRIAATRPIPPSL